MKEEKAHSDTSYGENVVFICWEVSVIRDEFSTNNKELAQSQQGIKTIYLLCNVK